MINLNEFDIEIAKREGLKQETNIGQIKEIRRIILQMLASCPIEDVLDLLEKYRK